VCGAAELHPPEQSRIRSLRSRSAWKRRLRRRGVGSTLFRHLIAEARAKGYVSLRITTGAQNEAMRALAHKFGAHLTFRHGESTGSIDLIPQWQPELASPATLSAADAARAMVNSIVRIGGCGCECLAGAGSPDRRDLAPVRYRSSPIRLRSGS